MTDYLEDYSNPFIQIFHEFNMFLFTAQYECTSNKMLSNVMLNIKRIHIRALCEFFRTKEQIMMILYTKTLSRLQLI